MDPVSGRENGGSEEAVKRIVIHTYIKQLLTYAEERQLIEREDKIDTVNQLLDLFELDEYQEPLQEFPNPQLESILQGMLLYAREMGILREDTVAYRDLFDTRIMGKLIPKPSVVISRFYERYRTDPKQATEYFYRFSQDSNYIRRYRIKQDLKWNTDTQYGMLEITVNLSKPEKDPRDIAAAKKAKQSGYPKCVLCMENEGYAGRVNYSARQNHRIIPITIAGQSWGFQYSPYVYYNEHCIILNAAHVPMKIDKNTFRKLLDFVGQFPHYFVGSNADLPIVGGSILSHDHFQGGNHQFPMAKAPIEKQFVVSGYEDVEAGIVKWPMSVIRLSGKKINRVAEMSAHILTVWRSYSDEEVFIIAETDEEPHNTITPIARKRGENYEIDLVLRNNITTDEHPLGVFHPHSNLHHIKKENIGLIEVMGLAVLPARLKEEMRQLAEAILAQADLSQNEALRKHAEWVRRFRPGYSDLNSGNIEGILQTEIGHVFEKVLEDAGVFKRDSEGQAAFERFIKSL